MPPPAPDRLSPDLLASPVSGVNLMPGSLRDQLSGETTLVVFLRHFGCMFCRETVSDLRLASQSDSDYPRVLFFSRGTPTEARAFLRRYWPEARVISDSDGSLYGAFGVERGGLVKMLGPAVWYSSRRARAKGHSNGDRVGEIWMMPGLFLVRGDEVLWSHDFRHAADHPEFPEISAIAAALSAAPP